MTPRAGGAAHPAIDEAVPFLEALLSKANPGYFLEIRAVSRQGRVYQFYHQVRNLMNKGMALALPFRLDGKANIYYGICPRVRRQGTADAVGEAVAVWFDEITRPPPDLPPFDWLVETSIGKVQGGYFLKEATSDLERVERLCRYLAAALGGDNVGDRARVLRLPGFINCKYDGGQRACLLELRPRGEMS